MRSLVHQDGNEKLLVRPTRSRRRPWGRRSTGRCQEAGSRPAGSTRSDGWTILIVDDNPEDRAEVRRLLLQGSPRRFRFIEAAAADAGLRLGLVSREERPDCMIVDFHLPDADAFETLARLRAGTKATPFPVVVVTDDLDHAPAREALQAGAHDYIGRKWMTPESLTRAVECAVARFARDEELRSTLRTLEEEQARLRVVLENLPVGVLLTDAAGRATLLNSALNDIWRGSRPLDDPDKYRSYRAWRGDTNELIEPGDWPVSLAMATGAPQAPCELKIERFDGTTGVILASAVPIRDHHGTLVGAASVVQDITDQKAAEDILRESEARFRTVLTHMLEGVNIADRQGILLYTNPAFDRMFGYPEGSLTGQHISILNAYPPHENQRRAQEIIDSVAARGSWQGEVHNRRRDGSLFYSQATVCVVEVGSESWYISVQDDITDRKRQEEERREQHARERHLREQAEAALRAKDEFVAVISHELRTPLNAIDGWVQILSSRATGDDLTQRAVATIERNVKAQTQLIGDLLDMSRILSGKMQLEIHRVDPEAVIASAIDSVRHAAEAKRVTIEVRRDPGVPKLDADPARLQQVIWNLVSNAVKFTPAGGRIEILLERLDGTLRIRVNDTGKGIAADFLPFVFDRFRQEDASARRQGGLGLGLSIVRHLVELHGGTVDVESPGEGLGASFTVDLPIPPSSRELSYPAVTGTAETDQASVDLSGMRVLVADDDNDTRDLFARFLRRCGATVVDVDSGAEALRQLSTGQSFDCLVCDLGMSEMDGWTTVSEVRSLDLHLPAIAVTAYASEADRTSALTAGFDVFLSKPVHLQDLAGAIATLVAPIRVRSRRPRRSRSA